MHVTTPNHVHREQVRAAFAAGKHVICEKPLATSSETARELLDLATASGLVHCTNFNVRYYPMVREALERVRAGELGRIWNVHGRYLQDWLAEPTDWNWRILAGEGGALRAVGDIGSHWLDLAELLSGDRVAEVFADLATAIPVRQRPSTPRETYAAATAGDAVPTAVDTEDIGHLLLRFASGARGSCVLSQVSFGRKNDLRIEVDGSTSSLAWAAEANEELWLGRRDGPNGVFRRQPTLMRPGAAAFTHLPPGAAEGFADTFRELYRAVYADVARGGPSATPAYPTFADGLHSALLCDAVAESARTGRWVAVAA